MADQKLRALKSFKYMTRRLRAGDDLEMTDKHADFWTRIGAVGPRPAAAPKRAAKVEVPVEQPAPEPVAEVEAPTSAAKKAAPKRRRKK